MRSLYPEITPFNTDFLRKGEHQIYFEESGNPEGLPVIFLHGGPGSGSNENHRRYFNPSQYHIINFDQRGCKRSTPNGCVSNNTTHDILEDIESIRKCLNIEKLFLFGGSWGATLALLYTESFPDKVSGMILRGCFLARQHDLDWFVKTGVNRIFPDYWQSFIGVIPENEQSNLIDAYHRRLFGNNVQEKEIAASAWAAWTGRVVTYLLPFNEAESSQKTNIEQTVNEVMIEMHYAKNAYFIEENQILAQAYKIPDIPVTIIHGRKDLTCTLDASWALQAALPLAELRIVNDGGHLAGEPVLIDALINATDQMLELL